MKMIKKNQLKNGCSFLKGQNESILLGSKSTFITQWKNNAEQNRLKTTLKKLDNLRRKSTQIHHNQQEEIIQQLKTSKSEPKLGNFLAKPHETLKKAVSNEKIDKTEVILVYDKKKKSKTFKLCKSAINSENNSTLQKSSFFCIHDLGSKKNINSFSYSSCCLSKDNITLEIKTKNPTISPLYTSNLRKVYNTSNQYMSGKDINKCLTHRNLIRGNEICNKSAIGQTFILLAGEELKNHASISTVAVKSKYCRPSIVLESISDERNCDNSSSRQNLAKRHAECNAFSQTLHTDNDFNCPNQRKISIDVIRRDYSRLLEVPTDALHGTYNDKTKFMSNNIHSFDLRSNILDGRLMDSNLRRRRSTCSDKSNIQFLSSFYNLPNSAKRRLSLSSLQV